MQNEELQKPKINVAWRIISSSRRLIRETQKGATLPKSVVQELQTTIQVLKEILNEYYPE